MRKYLGIFCTKEESDSLKLIINRLNCSRQALHPGNIHLLKDMTPEMEKFVEKQNELFVKNALEYQAQAQFLFEDWWSEAKKKYNLIDQIQIDTDRNEFFVAE